MLNLLLAAAAFVAHPSDPSPYFLDPSSVVKFECAHGSGSGFYIGDGKFITARHVVLNMEEDGTPNDNCRINGMPVHVITIGKGWVDYALVSAPISLTFRQIMTCRPFREGQTYYATGYAEGRPWPVTQKLIGTGAREASSQGAGANESLLRGAATEGMSGGPVVDENGVVVGIVSAGAEGGETSTMFLALADTPYCKKVKSEDE